MVSGPDETHQSQEPASRLQWRAQLQLEAVMQPLREQVSSVWTGVTRDGFKEPVGGA